MFVTMLILNAIATSSLASLMYVDAKNSNT